MWQNCSFEKKTEISVPFLKTRLIYPFVEVSNTIGHWHEKKKLGNFFQKCVKAEPLLDLSFWPFLTFLHHGIEKIERHLL